MNDLKAEAMKMVNLPHGTLTEMRTKFTQQHLDITNSDNNRHECLFFARWCWYLLTGRLFGRDYD